MWQDVAAKLIILWVKTLFQMCDQNYFYLIKHAILYVVIYLLRIVKIVDNSYCSITVIFSSIWYCLNWTIGGKNFQYRIVLQIVHKYLVIIAVWLSVAERLQCLLSPLRFKSYNRDTFFCEKVCLFACRRSVISPGTPVSYSTNLSL